MKKIIAVYGAANTGKTCAIRRLCAEMLKNGATLEQILPASPYNFEKTKKELILDLSDVSNNEDITVILSYRGLKIGFSSTGDCGYETSIRANLENLGDASCNIIICATRTRGVTCQTVMQYTRENGYELEWFSKLLINFDALWEKTAEVIQNNR